MRFLVPISILLLLGIDQVVKYWAETSLRMNGEIQLWPGVFHFVYVENRGAAFGMMQGKQTLFIIVTTLVLVGIVWYWRQIPKNKTGLWMKIALILVISGAIGNLIDRIWLGYVRDMFYFSLIDFPVFNIADICVVVGVMLLIPVILFGEEEKEVDQTLE